MLDKSHKDRASAIVLRYLGIRPTQCIHLEAEILELLQDVDDLARFETRKYYVDKK